MPTISGAEGAAFAQRMARLCALAAIVVVFAAVAYSRQSGFLLYALPFAAPFTVFIFARPGKTWQAWGCALPWAIIALTLISATLSIMHRAHMVPFFLMALLLILIAQLFFVRRALPGKIAFGTHLFRAILYYICLLLVVGATLPNWYVPPIVRQENKAVESLLKYSNALESYARTNAAYPVDLSALAAFDPGLICAQASCTKDGYRFEYRPLVKDGRVASYTISARPLQFEEPGKYSFLLAADHKIYQTRQDRDAVPADGER